MNKKHLIFAASGIAIASGLILVFCRKTHKSKAEPKSEEEPRVWSQEDVTSQTFYTIAANGISFVVHKDAFGESVIDSYVNGQFTRTITKSGRWPKLINMNQDERCAWARAVKETGWFESPDLVRATWFEADPKNNLIYCHRLERDFSLQFKWVPYHPKHSIYPNPKWLPDFTFESWKRACAELGWSPTKSSEKEF